MAQKNRRPLTVRNIGMMAEVVWKFDSDSYPPILHIPPGEDRQLFAMTHVLTHLAKNAGALATVMEAAGHGRKTRGRKKQILETCRKLIVNSMQFAQQAGFTSADIEAEILRWYTHQVGTAR